MAPVEKLTPLPLSVPKETDYNDSVESPYMIEVADETTSRFTRFKDSFRRKVVDESQKHEVGRQMSKAISLRHLILMALVTGIGTGLLVGTGLVLHKSGPLFLIIGFAIVGSFLYPTLQAAGEMAVNYSDLSGGYNNYPRRFIDESVAFAITWNYCIQWLSVISIELVTAAITISYWNTTVNADVWVTIFYVVIVSINFIGASGYGEAEFFIGSCKIMMIIGFIIMGIVVNVGGGPNHEFIGGRYWRDPGYYTNFKGLCSVFVTGSFAFGQTEFVALSASEQSNPRRAIPVATKLVAYRIVIVMLGSLTIVGLLVPYTSDRLMGSSGGGSHASPFVLAAALHGVKAVPSIINAVILMSVTSVASSALYSSSRTLQSLSEQGFAPSWLNYLDRTGRPLRAFFGLFSFIAAYKKQETVFNWLLAISGLSQIFTWGGICISHVRFRAALKYNNISTDSLGYVANTGVYGSYYAIIWYCLVLIAQFWIALYPKGEGKPNVTTFFQNYLGVIVLLFFYVCHKLWTRNWSLYVPLKDIDINLDRTLFDEELLAIEKEEEREKWRKAPFYKKIVQVLFL